MSKYHNDNTAASDPGGVRLSHAKLWRFHPELYDAQGRPVDESPEVLDEHLRLGDSRAAVVVSVNPLLVAAYTDELDCVAVLRFTEQLVPEYQLAPGTRLLTVNTYVSPTARGQPPARDLWHGPASYHRYVNFFPVIAEFVSDDLGRIDRRKQGIGEDEWRRAWDMGHACLRTRGPGVARDGRPLFSMEPA